MKKSIFSLIVLTLMFTLISVSCTSTPEPEAQQSAASEAPAPTSLSGAMARAEDARKRATDFECPAYFPSDWDAAEAQYVAAGNSPRSTASEIQQAVASYNAAADVYDDLFKKTIPLYAQAREDEVMIARDDLIATGFTHSFPDYLEKADEIALEALDQYEAGNYYEAKDTAAKALYEYDVLMNGGKIFLARQEVVDRGFWVYDSDNFDKADEVTITAINEYEAGNKETAVANAEEALLRYNLVLSNGWTAYSVDRRNSAVSERELALSERANIAARDSFREAEAIYNQAEETYSSENFQNAAILFTDAEALFMISRYETDEKRVRAIETIRLAEEKIEESNETAIEAERIIEGGSR
jgi:hypothetical protein